LRKAYDERITGGEASKYYDVYEDIAKWMETPTLSQSLKDLADRYHYHLTRASLKHKEHNLLPAIRRGDRQNAEAAWPIAIYFDNIRSAHNVGSILRTIEAFSMGEAYFSDDTPFVTHKQVKDAAMGADKWTKCHQGIPLSDLPRPLIALETSSQAVPLTDFIFPEAFTLVLGNEEYGCSDQTLQEADFLVEIPLRGHKNSLNVANAFAIVAAEIYRQKRATKE
jgi:tRNA G18 (ribose-2'-O)-methylase SpoU